MNIGKRIRELRENARLTQEDVGKRIGVTKATVNRYETGEIDIKRTIAIKLGEIFNVSPAYIMGWTDEPTDVIARNAANLDLTEKDNITIAMFKQLDEDDKSEIRGEIKQMLKADKYKKISGGIADDMANDITKLINMQAPTNSK